MIYLNGERYVGMWLNDMKSGIGVWYYTDGSKYDGEWKDDLMNGQGLLII